MENLKHLKTFEQFSDIDGEEMNEGIFGGLNKDQEAKVKELATKNQLEDADLADTKLISAVLNAFKLANPGSQQGDKAMKIKNDIVKNPSNFSTDIKNAINAYAKGLAPENSKFAKLYSLDNSGKLVFRLGMLGKAGVASELGQ